MLIETALTLVVALPPAHNPNPWESVAKEDHLEVWVRDVPNSDLREIKAETVVEVPSKRVWQVLNDFPHYPEFMPYVEQARILEGKGQSSMLVYQRINPPLVSRRDYVIRLSQTADAKTGVYVREIVGAPNKGPPPYEDILRLTDIKGLWVLEPLGPNKTRILYQMYTDPGGIPTWIANKASRRSVPQLLENVAQRSKDPTWQQ